MSCGYVRTVLVVHLVLIGLFASKLAPNNAPVVVPLTLLPQLTKIFGTTPQITGSNGQDLLQPANYSTIEAPVFAPNDIPISLSLNPPVSADDLEKVAELAGDAKRAVEKAQGVIRQLKEQGAWLQNFIAGEQKKLPVGIKQNIGGATVILALSEMRLKATHSEVDVYLQVEFPGVEDPLILGATDVEFSWRGGFGDLRLELLADYGINIAKKKSRLIFYKAVGGTSTQPSTDGTFAVVTCGGIEELNVKATLMMSRDWVVPVRNGVPQTNAEIAPGTNDDTPQVIAPTASMSVQKNARVHWDFAINVNGGDFIIETGSRDTFVINKYPDIQIYANDIALDFSDTRNPGALTFPDNYNSPFVTDGNALDLWRGVYIGGIAVQLPEKWRKEGRPPMSVYATSIIVDERGFTGTLGITNLLPLEEGDAGGWPLSVDDFSMRFMQSQIEQVKFEGLIRVPLIAKYAEEEDNDEDQLARADCLGYVANIEPGSFYQFTAETEANYRIPMWKSEVLIKESSSLDITYEDGDLTATAILHGELDIDVGVGDNFRFEAKDMTFDNLTISSDGGLVDIGQWGFPDTLGGQLGAFAFTITDLNLDDSDPSEPTLAFGVNVEIGANETNLAAGGAFRILGRYEIVNDRQKFRYEDFKIDALTLDMTTSSFGVSATISVYRNHDIYGSGFYGSADLWFKALGGDDAGMAAVAQFGEVDDYKYFFIDCLMRFGDAAPPVGPFKLLGAGGGVWVNMSLDRDADEVIEPNANQEASSKKAAIEAGIAEGTPDALSSFIGKSLSNQRLLPDQANLFGIKVTLVVGLITPSPRALSVNGTFLMEVNEHNGFIAQIKGNATFFGDVNWNNDIPESGFTAFFDVAYVNDPDDGTTFTATVDVFAKIGSIKGNATGGGTPNTDMYAMSDAGYAGRIQLYAGPTGWFFNIGQPKIALGLDLLGSLTADVSAYFHLGNNISPMPDPPDYVTELVGGGNNFMRNESMYASGNGVAFGAQLTLRAEPRLLIFYADIMADFGFDINLQRYEGVRCLETNREMGVNGWYAAGQAWAYLSGSIGLEFRIPFRGRVQLEVLHASLAALLQAKGPNPFNAAGRVAGRYRLLGGLIKGGFNMNFKVGKACTLAAEGGGDLMSNAQLITAMIPNDESDAVSPDEDLFVLTSFQVREFFDLDEERYKLIEGDFSLTGPNGPIPGRVSYDVGDMLVRFRPDNVLPANTTLTFTAEMKLQKGFSSSNIVNDQTESITFTTGDGLETIPLTNVEMSYPIDGMYNFYEDEADEGFMKLELGQPELFENNDVWAVFTRSGSNPIGQRVSYNAQSRKATFDIPNLSNDKVYQMALVRSATNPGGGGTTQPNGSGGDPNQNNDQQPGIPQNGGFNDGGPLPNEYFTFSYPWATEDADTLLTIYFRTSEYRTLEAKIDAVLADRDLNSAQDLRLLLSAEDERFDAVELNGLSITDSAPLIKMEAVTNSGWFSDLGFKNNLYDNLDFRYNNTTVKIEWREVENSSRRIPSEEMYFSTSNDDLTVNASHFSAGGMDISAAGDTFNFLFPKLVVQDVERFHDTLVDLLEPHVANVRMYIQDPMLWSIVVANLDNDGGGTVILDTDPDADPNAPENAAPTWDDDAIRRILLTLCTRRLDGNNCGGLNNLGSCPNYTGSIPCGEDKVPGWLINLLEWPSGSSNPWNNPSVLYNKTFPVKFKYRVPGLSTRPEFTVNMKTPAN